MDKGVAINELLSAYLTGDVQPAEREAVERLLAADPAVRAQAGQLRALLGTLNRAKLPLNESLVQKLDQKAAALTPPPATVTPQLESETLTQFLKRGEKHVPAQLSRALAERLCAALPPGVIPRPASVTARHAISSAPTVRVFAPPETPWRRRIAWAAAAVAAAALVALAFGMGLLGPRASRENNIAKDANQPKTPRTIAPERTPERDAPREIVKTPAPKSDAPNVAPENRVPAPPEVVQTPAPGGEQRQPVVPPAPDVVQQTPKSRDVQRPDAPAPEKTHEAPVVAKENNVVPPPRLPDTPQPEVAVPKKTHSPGGGAIMPGPSVNQNNPTVAADNTTKEPPTVPLTDMARVLKTADGNVMARRPDGASVPLTAEASLPSGSEITTDRGRAAIALPGDGRLWINRGSNLIVRFTGKDTTVELNRGEIAYAAPTGGSLTLSAHKVGISKANGRVDALISGNAVRVYALDKEATVSAKGSVRIAGGSMAVANLSGNDAPRKDVFDTPHPDIWHYDLDQIKIPTGEPQQPGRQKRNERSRSR
jgi:ferric-dicitrate binding protein FerR (iron transport regulator)